MPYQNLTLPTLPDRPFFYTSFVSTIDGKVQINKDGYWPIGSRVDYDTFTYLRSHADAIIDGKNTALKFGKNTVETIHSNKFVELRKKIGQTKTMQYIIMTKHPDGELMSILKNPYGNEPLIFTKDIKALVDYLKKEHLDRVFIDGGPHLLASFFENDLIDEVFLTIAPRIFGNSENAAITMVEGQLFAPDKIKLEVVSMEQVENEIFLRYKVLH